MGSSEKQPLADHPNQMQLGIWQLWRSLPRPCKLFLVVSVLQAFVSGAFAVQQLAKGTSTNLQDLVMILISSASFLLVVLDAFWHENGYQLLVSMASGGLSLVQLVIYATTLAGRDSASLGVVLACAVLQAVAVGLARWAYLGFGWRMYSKIACDALLPDAENRRAVGLRLDRFAALAKLDIQLMALLFVVGIVNGVNPSSADSSLVPLLVLAAVGVPAAAGWLGVCWIAVARNRPRIGLAAEFTFPLCYIVAAAYMFSSVYYGARLGQLHGQEFLIIFPVLFVIGRTCVWWDARLLSGSDVLNGHASHHKTGFAADSRRKGGKDATGNNTTPRSGHTHSGPHVPPEMLPLVHGAWLLKLPSSSFGATTAEVTTSGAGLAVVHTLGTSFLRDVISAAAGGHQGRWRYFQLSHDGSTLRWDWRKYVLMVHVESVTCCTADLTITLSLTLEPDLRLKFPNAELHTAWSKGLTLLVTLLGNPDGLEGQHSGGLLPPPHPTSASLHYKSKTVPSAPGSTVMDPGSPSRLLARLASASARPSATGMVTKEALRAAAWQVRRALGDFSEPATPAGGVDDDEIKDCYLDLENGRCLSGASPRWPAGVQQNTTGHPYYTSISLHATTVGTPTRPSSGGLRQRTPPSSSHKEKEGRSWLRRTFTAPIQAVTDGLRLAVGEEASVHSMDPSATRQLQFNAVPSESANVHSGVDLEANPVRPLSAVGLPKLPPAVTALRNHQPHHYRSQSLDDGSRIQQMPAVPEGSSGFVVQVQPTVAVPVLPGSTTTARTHGGSPSSTIGGSPKTTQGSGSPMRRMRRRPGGSPLKFAGQPQVPQQSTHTGGVGPQQQQNVNAGDTQGADIPGVSGLQHGLLRYGSAPIQALQRALSEMEAPENSGAGVSNAVGMETPTAMSAASLARYDSLGPHIAPGSKLWQAMFDAGMVAMYQHSADGSPSPVATPHSVQSVTRNMAVNMELIDFDQLSFGRKLGEGAEGPVYAAWFQETPVAVKRASCQMEVDLHVHAGWHDNVVNLRGLAQHGGHTYLVMELCPRGTLDVLIHQSAASSPLRMDPSKLLPIVRSIARGMLHLHTRSPPIMHRDLKPANIFIGHGYVMKIGDFGMARYAADTRAQRAYAHLSRLIDGSYDPARHCKPSVGPALLRTLTPGVIGTAAYSAPELLHPETPKAPNSKDGGTVGTENDFDPEPLLKADVYAFGVLLWEMLERRRPYAGMDGFQVQTQWVLDPASMRLKAPKVPEGLPPVGRRVMQVLSDLVVACTAWEPSERPTFKQILAVLREAGHDGHVPPPLKESHLVSPF